MKPHTQRKENYMPKDLLTKADDKEPENYVDAIYLVELIDRINSQRKVADLIGISQSTVARIKNTGRCSLPMELAAEALVRRMEDDEQSDSPAERPALVIGHIERGDLEVVNRVLAGFGVSLTEIEVPA